MERMRSRSITPAQPPKALIRLLSRKFSIIGVFLLLAAVYSYLIISGDIVEKAKIQENALLAGLVEEGWRDSSRLREFLRELNRVTGKGLPRSELRNFIFDAFNQMRVEVFRHRFNSIQSSFSRQNSTLGSGENVYAIVRSFRAEPVEAILLLVPMRASHVDSLAVALAYADYAKKQLYWARDLIFLFTDGGNRLAAEAWLADYHGQQHPFLVGQQAEEAEMVHGGTIIGAFGLDIAGNLFDRIELQYGMMNGKLPNMDLLNLFVLLTEKAGAMPTVNGVVRARGEYDWRGAAETLTNGMVAQSLDEMAPLTSVFGRFGLNAVTVRGRQAAMKRHSTAIDLADVVRMVEGGMRSLNNLLEKFHHSYLLYLLTHPHRFIPAALFMPLLGLLLAPILLIALHEWFALGGFGSLSQIGAALSSIGRAHFFALVFYALQNVFYMEPRCSARSVAQFSLAVPIVTFFLLLPFFRPKMSAPNFHFARFATALELCLFLGALGLVHFPLALLLALFFLPISIASLTRPLQFPLLARLAAFLLLNPISLAAILLPFKFCAGQSASICLQKITAKIASIALSHFVHSSWLLALLSGPVLAICLCFGQILLANVAKEKEANGGEIDGKKDEKLE